MRSALYGAAEPAMNVDIKGSSSDIQDMENLSTFPTEKNGQGPWAEHDNIPFNKGTPEEFGNESASAQEKIRAERKNGVLTITSQTLIDTYYIYTHDGKLLAEYNDAGNCVRDYIYSGNSLVAEYRPQGSDYYYYTSDQINSVRIITDSNGDVVYSAAYSPFGKVQHEWESTYDPKLKYSGKEREAISGLDYFGARYYNHSQYRFNSVDPIINRTAALLNPQLWNLYSYCRNNPITYLDPDGRDLKPVNLPGIGDTYLDHSFIPIVKSFISKAKQAGIEIIVNKAFRTSEEQAALQDNPNAITPAAEGTSLHEAGSAIDINVKSKSESEIQKIVEIAKSVGLSWGGYFKRPKPDPPHFYKEVPGGRMNRPKYIKRAQSQYKKFQYLKRTEFR